MTEMIAAEPALTGRLLSRLADPRSEAADLAAGLATVALRGGPVRLVGCGTSEHAAMGAAHILADALGAATLPPVDVASQEAFEASLTPPGLLRRGLTLAISHEGGTWATNEALAAARAAGGRTALITAAREGPGASLADLLVATGELDQSWCHTVGYLSPLLVALAVATHLAGTAWPTDGARRLVTAAAGLGDRAALMATALAGLDRLLIVGSGADRPAARELALKIEEGAHLPATARDLETLLHGHLAAANATAGLVLILADRAGRARRSARARQVLAVAQAIGLPAAAIVAADADLELPAGLTPAGRLVIPEGPDLPPAAAALLATAPALQLLAERLARARGADPDTLRRGEAVYREAAARGRGNEPPAG
ncbi:MAG: hypothetical protein ACRDGL_03680 [Candidatus Limnocylindrales bacterium]